jgi:hypothetical protein
MDDDRREEYILEALSNLLRDFLGSVLGSDTDYVLLLDRPRHIAALSNCSEPVGRQLLCNAIVNWAEEEKVKRQMH